MIFLFRAVFWTAVVAAFIPAGFYAPSDGAFARQAEQVAHTTRQAGMRSPVEAAEVCTGREALCETASEFVQFAGWTASLAAGRAESAYQDITAAREQTSREARLADEVFAAAAGEPAAR